MGRRNSGVCIRTALTPVQRELFIDRTRRENIRRWLPYMGITVSERIEVRNPYQWCFVLLPVGRRSDEVMAPGCSPMLPSVPDAPATRKTQAQRCNTLFVNCAHCRTSFFYHP
ncbi:MAG: hypothetical protein ACLRS8_01105 [Parabacteroides merdae]